MNPIRHTVAILTDDRSGGYDENLPDAGPSVPAHLYGPIEKAIKRRWESTYEIALAALVYQAWRRHEGEDKTVTDKFIKQEIDFAINYLDLPKRQGAVIRAAVGFQP